MKTSDSKNQVYNYKNFSGEYYNLSNFPGPKPGDKFEDVILKDIHGNDRALSDFLDKPLVIESGSITCPMYANCIPKMEEYRKSFSNINFILVYVREAHPGERRPEHTSMEDKTSAAKKVSSLYNDNRLTLVDSMNGEFHQKYGSLPNILYVINKNGVVVYRGDWNDPEKVKTILQQLENRNIHPDKHVSPKFPLRFASIKVVLTGGFRALWDVLLNLGRLKQLHKAANEKYANQ